MTVQRFIRYLFFLMILFGGCSDPVDENAPRQFDKDAIAEYNESEKYNYDREFEEDPSDEESSDGLGWFAKLIGNILSAIALLFNNVIGYVFLLGLVVLLVYIVSKNTDGFFNRTGKNIAAPVVISQPENIEEEDYGQLLNKALQDDDYQLAIRYNFLNCLKFLQQSKLIQWHREKTNYEYLLEVPQNYHDSLDQLIYIYEYVWYGKFKATRETYQKLALQAEIIQKKGGKG